VVVGTDVRILSAAVAALALATAAAPAGAAPGDLDPSFGTDGVTRSAVGSGQASLSRMRAAPDGGLVAQGLALSPDDDPFGPPYPKNEITLGRYSADGILDPTFGTGGFAQLPRSGDDTTVPFALVVGPGGSLLSAGQVGTSPNALVATHSGGGELLDTLTSSTVNSLATGLARQSDGGLIVAITWRPAPQDKHYYLRRVTPAGDWDDDFGSVELPFATWGLTADGDDRLTAVASGVSGTQLTVVRRLADGSPDASFGIGGEASVTLPGSAVGVNLAPTPDGGLLAVGDLGGVGNHGLVLARFGPDGEPLSTFGDDGVAWTPLPVSSWSSSEVTVAPDGRILVPGTVDTGAGTFEMGVAAFTADGQLEPDFGDGGIVSLDFPPTAPNGPYASASSVVVQPDGRIVVGGTSAGGPAGVWTLVGLEGWPTQAPTGPATPEPVAGGQDEQSTATDHDAGAPAPATEPGAGDGAATRPALRPRKAIVQRGRTTTVSRVRHTRRSRRLARRARTRPRVAARRPG
jgi:uncharacterized delta-60 repeat protein